MSNPSNEERRRSATQLKTKVKSLTSPIPYLSYSRFSDLRAQTVPLVLIDVREHEENSVSTLPSAIYSSQAMQHIQRLKQRNSHFNVVCFCTVGFRSGLFAKKIASIVQNVYNYSIMEHIWGGGMLVSPQGEERTRVHVYHSTYFNVFPEKYEMEVFGNMKAFIRGLGILPGIMSAMNRGKTPQEEEPIGS